MSIIRNHKVNEATVPQYIKSGGTQYITGELVFPASPGTATVILSASIYGTGIYCLFDYSASESATPVQNLSQMVVDISNLDFAGSYSITDDADLKKVLITINSKYDNGTQYVDGVLTIGGPITITLSGITHGTAGTYTLFSYNSLVGSISDITIVPPSGRYIDSRVSPNGCAIVNNTITVSLI